MSRLRISMFVAIATIFLISCGSNETPKQQENLINETTESYSEPEKPDESKILNTIPYSDFKIFAKDKKYFKMEEGGEAEIELNERGFAEITAEFELVKTYDKEDGQYFVSMIAKDKKGKTVELSSTTNGEVRSDDSDGSRFLNFMLSEPGEKMVFVFTGSVSQSGSFSPDIKKTKEAVKKIKYFEVKTTKY